MEMPILFSFIHFYASTLALAGYRGWVTSDSGINHIGCLKGFTASRNRNALQRMNILKQPLMPLVAG